MLWSFISPYWEPGDDPEVCPTVVSMATCAWNLALLRDKGLPDKIEELLDGILDPEQRDETECILRNMIERKQRHFTRDRRFILDYSLVPYDEGFHLTVLASTID